jgi:coenzyme F420-reducing hydrogenase delta subunit
LATGIDLPDPSLRTLRDRVHAAASHLVASPRVLVFGCDHAVPIDALAGDGVAGVSLPCIGALPPSFVDYVLSRKLADGVFLTGCRDGACFNRFGLRWTEARVDGTRDPRLRKRVPRERVARQWADRQETPRLVEEIEAFRRGLIGLPLAAEAPPMSAVGVRKPTP